MEEEGQLTPDEPRMFARQRCEHILDGTATWAEGLVYENGKVYFSVTGEQSTQGGETGHEPERIV